MQKKGKIDLTQFGTWAHRLLPGTRIGDLTLTERVYQDTRDVEAGTKTEAQVLAQVAGWVVDDLGTMMANGKVMHAELGLPDPKPPAPRFTGLWTPAGKEVSVPRVFAGHTFTDVECQALLAGAEISFPATTKDGKTFTARGSLGERAFKGDDGKTRIVVGFTLAEGNQVIDGVEQPPPVWCGHTFTSDEIAALLAGQSVTGSGFVGKSGKKFAATLTSEDGPEGQGKVIVPVFTPRSGAKRPGGTPGGRRPRGKAKGALLATRFTLKLPSP